MITVPIWIYCIITFFAGWGLASILKIILKRK